MEGMFCSYMPYHLLVSANQSPNTQWVLMMGACELMQENLRMPQNSLLHLIYLLTRVSPAWGFNLGRLHSNNIMDLGWLLSIMDL